MESSTQNSGPPNGEAERCECECQKHGYVASADSSLDPQTLLRQLEATVQDAFIGQEVRSKEWMEASFNSLPASADRGKPFFPVKYGQVANSKPKLAEFNGKNRINSGDPGGLKGVRNNDTGVPPDDWTQGVSPKEKRLEAKVSTKTKVGKRAAAVPQPESNLSRTSRLMITGLSQGQQC